MHAQGYDRQVPRYLRPALTFRHSTERYGETRFSIDTGRA